ncbi:gamma-glutamyltransferase [candidate division KSB1 bacterium 4572_119]|nr:MAG: gamma-glutamyltransferase [candidate division KSB1 bacterium 4572_119]
MKNVLQKSSTLTLISILIFIFASILTAEETGKNGMVVTAHPMASEFGLEILKSGGNAVDAAVGSAIVLGVTEPHASGFGGGGGMLIYLHDLDSLTYINYYARAPRLIPTNYNSYWERKSAISVLVPGNVAGLHLALQKYGTISWEDLLKRVISKVKNGFEVDEKFYKIILDSYESLLKYSQTKAIYLVNDFPPEVGQKIQNHRILLTLEKLAEGGPDIFYKGEIADSIEAAMIRNGSGLRKSDLEAYRPIELQPVRGSYRGYEIVSAPPPQSGTTIVEILNILEFKDLSAMGDYTNSIPSFHFMVEAMKRGFADRLFYLGDPKFIDVPVSGLISKDFAESRFQTIDMQRADPVNPKETPFGDMTPFLEKKDPDSQNKDGSTTHISVVDGAGNAVSLTQTLNHFWGCGVSVCGFLLNNGMTAFSSTNPANNVQSGRQPRSTISPTMMFKEKDLRVVVGSPGAGRIISTVVEVICNLVDFDKTAEQANQAPRFHSRKWINNLPVEDRFSPEMLEKLKEMGHRVQVLGQMDLFFGGVQLIVVDPKRQLLIGSSDLRRSGVAIGY